ncbi:MAG: hypothetical protein JW920_09990 [Deltaproteobacteria bacterium]|nr:hypothetical protein [Deltaproteobacteria bacterium]
MGKIHCIDLCGRFIFLSPAFTLGFFVAKMQAVLKQTTQFTIRNQQAKNVSAHLAVL